MTNPVDAALALIQAKGYHNHRLETHSDTVSDGMLADLLATCGILREDFDAGVIKAWKNVSSPGDRLRKVDLFIGEPDDSGLPDIHRVRIAVEHKSVITAHRNRTSRFDDLRKVLSAIHHARPETILVATVLVGLCDRVLNIPDQVHKFYRDREDEFVQNVLPRLSTGDNSLWTEFSWAVSTNSLADPEKTVALFRSLPTRAPGHTHVEGYDFVLIAPVSIDNVNEPTLPRPNSLGLDVDAQYAQLLTTICAAYTARWHL